MLQTTQSLQAPKAIIMVRPHQFSVNQETAYDNHFQRAAPADFDTATQAYDEISAAATTLASHGIKVHLFEDTGDKTPDSVFPNNWFSTHQSGRVGVYPMKPNNRRLERRSDIIDFLKAEYRVADVVDYSGMEQDQVFLEGTGAMVLDHIHGIAYVALSERAHASAVNRFCSQFGFHPICFHATDGNGIAVYHTNVMMGLATEFAMVGLDLIRDPDERKQLVDSIESTGRTVINLTEQQIQNFAGNVIELQGRNGLILALSQTAYDCLSAQQIAIIERSAALVPMAIPTVELAGGSVRCTIAGIHLTPRHNFR